MGKRREERNWTNLITTLLLTLLVTPALGQDARLLALEAEAKRELSTLAVLDRVIQETGRRLDVGRLVSIDANLDVTGDWPKALIEECKKTSLSSSEIETITKKLTAIPQVAQEKVFTLSHDLVQRMFEDYIALVELDLAKRTAHLERFTIAEVGEDEAKERKSLSRLIYETNERFGSKGLLRLTVGDDRPYRSYRDETNLMNLHGKRLALPGNDSRWLKLTILWLKEDQTLAIETRNIVIASLSRVLKGVDEDTDVKPRTILGAVVRAREEQRRAYLKIVSALRQEVNLLLIPTMKKIAGE